jgi:pimeloyl-ACP methyl ester carboxylesterase
VSVSSGWNELDLNGARQWISLRGDPAAPILLFLHGGPGGAEYGPRRHYLRRLEADWCVVDWEQRGAGRSYSGAETPANLSIDIIVDDGIALIERLRSEFAANQIVLVGHSFGTVLGLLMASKAAPQIDAYVGASQVVNWAWQELSSYQWALAEATRTGNQKAITALSAIGPPERGCYPGGTASVEVQRRWLGTLGGVTGDPHFLTRWALTILLAPDYPLVTKFRYTRGMAHSMDIIWPELGERIDFLRDLISVDVPVYIFAGERDRITDLAQTRRWFYALKAPHKRLEVVESAGHLNLFEAPERFAGFLSAIKDELTATRTGRDIESQRADVSTMALNAAMRGG